MAEDSKVLAAAAKGRGNAAFAKKTKEGYEEALVAYQEAITHDPDDHVFYANCSAAHIELGGQEWEPAKRVLCYGRALVAARECTSRNPSWAKGWVRQSTAEIKVIAAIAKREERKRQDEKWRKEDDERAERDRKEGREPFTPHREKDEEATADPDLELVLASASYVACEAACRKGLELEPTNAQLRTRLQEMRDLGHATNEEEDRAMRNPEAAAGLKAQGNSSFSAKKWAEAAKLYTQALEQDPFDHVFYSNRSACSLELDDMAKALRDAEKCIALNSSFAKGYSRQANALYHLGRFVDMDAAVKAGLAVDPANAPLQELQKQAQVEVAEPLEVQKHMYKLRQEKKQAANLQNVMKGLNMQGSGVQMFTPGAGGMDDFLKGLGGGGGGGGGGFMGGDDGKARMTEEQMRGMARARAQAPGPSSSA